MNSNNINWEQETEFYFLVADRYVKFGISTDWDRREKAYKKNELKEVEFRKIKTVKFENRWQAELIEQIMKWRLRRWAVPGKHEWIENLTVQNVVDCYQDTLKELSPEYKKHQHIHSRGNERWDFYKQIADYYFN